MQHVAEHQSKALEQVCDVWFVFFFFSLAALPNQKIHEMFYI